MISCGLLEDGGLSGLDESEGPPSLPLLHRDFKKQYLIFGELYIPLEQPRSCGSPGPEVHCEGPRTVRVVQHGMVSIGTEGSRKEGNVIKGAHLIFVGKERKVSRRESRGSAMLQCYLGKHAPQ